MLYDYLKIVGNRALYHDTGKTCFFTLIVPDSICFISREKEPEPKLGEFLGCLSDQLEDEYGVGSYATRYVSGGCKNYAYTVAFSKNVAYVFDKTTPGWRHNPSVRFL